MAEVDWKARTARLPDEDLFEIVAAGNPGDFEQNVILAATAELEKRSLEATVVERIETQLAEARQFETARATLPLSNWAWVAFVIFGVVIFWTLVAAYILRHRGYRLKSRQAVAAIPISIGFWSLVGLALARFAP
jgi:hypothetical protein